MTKFRDREALFTHQKHRLGALLDAILPRNRFYARKYADVPPAPLDTMEKIRRLPITTKAELQADQNATPPYGTNLTWPIERYTRYHQTSGSLGTPLRWLDTPETWDWMLGCWRQMFAMAGLTASDRAFFPFSFGPFLGFWTAFEAAGRLGCLTIPAGGMTTLARLRMMIDVEATVLFCTPTYALHLATAAEEAGLNLRQMAKIRRIIVAGEPGGNVPATRSRIESAWGARVFDHSGMTEVGPMCIECDASVGGLHILESEYLAEVVDPASLATVADGTPGELIVTNLGRLGSPLIRYRTNDIVCIDPVPCPCGRLERRFRGGILGRTDDMIAVRGNNVFPSAIENVLRRFPEVAEYRVTVDADSPLAELRIEIETSAPHDRALAERVARTFRDELLFRPEVSAVPAGTLPRFEMKAKRIHTKPRTGSP